MLSTSRSLRFTFKALRRFGLCAMSTSTEEIVWLHEVDSTMTQAKVLLKQEEYQSKKIFAVVGDYQTAGRGTRGRNWVSTIGNLYMTLVINMSDVPVELTLTPIRIGTFIIQAIDKVLVSERTDVKLSRPKVQLKWPNDVLVNGDKVSGVLIEVEGKKLLIGIGCNIATAPTNPDEGPDSGCRDATALSRYLFCDDDEAIDIEHSNAFGVRNHLALELYHSMEKWISIADTADTVVQDFQSRMDDSWQVLRRDHHLTQGFEYNDEVKPLRLNYDGTLQVFHKKSNSERTLTAEYLR